MVKLLSLGATHMRDLLLDARAKQRVLGAVATLVLVHLVRQGHLAEALLESSHLDLVLLWPWQQRGILDLVDAERYELAKLVAHLGPQRRLGNLHISLEAESSLHFCLLERRSKLLRIQLFR